MILTEKRIVVEESFIENGNDCVLRALILKDGQAHVQIHLGSSIYNIDRINKIINFFKEVQEQSKEQIRLNIFNETNKIIEKKETEK